MLDSGRDSHAPRRIATITTGSSKHQTPGQLCYDADFTPYGQEISHTERLQTTACPPNYKFTGYERGPETGLDYAFARYYSSRLGRFLSTDPLRGAIGDLQSHNAYAYVRNNPISRIDPTGKNDCEEHADCGDGGWWAVPQPGQDLFGGSSDDLLGCGWADFWGGDCGAIWHMLDPSGRHQSQLLEDYARYLSILNTGWEPEFHRYEWGWHDLKTNIKMAMQNPNCGALFGGTANGIGLVNSTPIESASQVLPQINQQISADMAANIDNPSYESPSMAAAASATAIGEGLVPAGLLGGPSGQIIAVGPGFGNLPMAQQMGLVMHELRHEAFPNDARINALSASNLEMNSKCGTDTPPEPQGVPF